MKLKILPIELFVAFALLIIFVPMSSAVCAGYNNLDNCDNLFYSISNPFGYYNSTTLPPSEANFTNVAFLNESLPFTATQNFTGQTVFKKGLVSAPSMSFDTDENSGWYYYQDGAVAWSGNGGKVLHITPTVVQLEKYLYMSSQRIEAVDWIGLANGGAGTPSVRFTSDGDTGMYRKNTNQLGFTAGATNSMWLTPEGLTIAGGALGSYQYTLNLGNNAQNLNGIGAYMFRINPSSTARYGNMMEIKSGTTAYNIFNRRGFFYTGDSLTQNPTSRIQNEGETFLNGRLVAGDTIIADTTSLGSEMITNGNFTGNANNWTYDATWAYGTDDIRKAVSSGTGSLSQTLGNMTIPIEVGKTYLLYFTLSSYNGAENSLMTISCGGYSYQPLDSGVHKLVFKAESLDPLTFTPAVTATRVYVDSVSLKEVTDGDLNVVDEIKAGGNITTEGYVIATDFLTGSKVINPEEDSLSKLDNIDSWLKVDGTIDYPKHYAFVNHSEEVTDYSRPVIIIEDVENCQEKITLNKTSGENITTSECVVNKLPKTTYPYTKIEYSNKLSMETRVAEMENMINQLRKQNKLLTQRVTDLEKNINFDTYGVDMKESIEPKPWWEFWK